VATKKTSKSAENEPKLLSPREKLQFKTQRKEDDWYEAAFKRFSISLNRTSQQRDPLATLDPPIKPSLE
jgi:hypothetical protein